jgi:hypothetical protein
MLFFYISLHFIQTPGRNILNRSYFRDVVSVVPFGIFSSNKGTERMKRCYICGFFREMQEAKLCINGLNFPIFRKVLYYDSSLKEVYETSSKARVTHLILVFHPVFVCFLLSFSQHVFIPLSYLLYMFDLEYAYLPHIFCYLGCTPLKIRYFSLMRILNDLGFAGDVNISHLLSHLSSTSTTQVLGKLGWEFRRDKLAFTRVLHAK